MILVLLVVVVICAGLSAAVLLTNMGRHQEAETAFHRERAFMLAEAGTDWAICQLRIRNGEIPTTPIETRTQPKAGDFTVRYVNGNANGRDDDGDGTVDNLTERNYAVVTSTGSSGGMRRTVEVLMRKAVEVPSFDSPVQINVEAPLLDLSGNAFVIDGREHTIDGTYDPTRPAKAGLATPADVADVVAQIDATRYDNIIGSGGVPSVEQVAPMDLNRLVQQASVAATVILEPGTHTHLDLGEPTMAGVTVAYCAGDLHLSGGGSGAGVLAVDGDLTISGGFEWVGIILVRGRVVLTGGGGGTRLIGALGVGEEVTSTTSSTEVSFTGTVDLMYSSDAVEMAANRLAVMSVMSWREVANP